jgi:hypothetical protein
MLIFCLLQFVKPHLIFIIECSTAEIVKLSLFLPEYFVNELFVYSSQACYGKYIYIYIYIYVMQIILFSSVEKDFLLDLVNLSLTFYFQSSFGTIDQTEILWQCSSASCYLILFSKNLRRRSSNS